MSIVIDPQQKQSKVVGLSEHSEDVLEIVSRDLNRFLEDGHDRQKRLSFLSRKTEIHQKTLKRLAQKENRPSGETVLKLYRFFLNVERDIDVLDGVTGELKKYLDKCFSREMLLSTASTEDDASFFKENPVAIEIYLIGAIQGITTGFIRKKFGEYGLKILGDLVKERFLSEKSPDEFTIGQRQFRFSPEMVIQSGKISVNAYAKPQLGYETGKHFAGFYGEKLNWKAYQKWIEIDQRAMREKMELAQKKESLGDIPAFCFNIVETYLNEDDL